MQTESKSSNLTEQYNQENVSIISQLSQKLDKDDAIKITFEQINQMIEQAIAKTLQQIAQNSSKSSSPTGQAKSPSLSKALRSAKFATNDEIKQ